MSLCYPIIDNSDLAGRLLIGKMPKWKRQGLLSFPNAARYGQVKSVSQNLLGFSEALRNLLKLGVCRGQIMRQTIFRVINPVTREMEEATKVGKVQTMVTMVMIVPS